MAKKKKCSSNNENNEAENFSNDFSNEQAEERFAREIFVYAEITNEDGKMTLHPVVAELLNAARKLAEKYSNTPNVCSIISTNNNINDDFDTIKKTLYANGSDKVYFIKNEKIKNYTGIAKAVSEFCKINTPEIFLIGATIIGRSIAPLISSSLNTGLTADCTKLEITNFKDEKKLAATRPTFGGQLMATILCKNLPQMATVRPHVLQKRIDAYKENGEFEEFIPNLDNFNDCLTILNTEINKNKLSSELENAQVVVAGGKGLKNEENFQKLIKFAGLIGASYAGSRGAVDMGLIDKEHQIGQTGKTIAPKVYIAFGISGAIHHMVGISNAKKIIAINNDENAPIFENSDIAIVEDAPKVLDELIAELEKNEIPA